ncbi:helix-turn-helix transcriptional regulator [Cellulosilyticum lentocellum]|uniref:DNA binding domain protein, excisionase family n=1 Tax=Cellulosilyticum lentocellum (strain ATCC 49066 / DSM 5427 / NCIMB 11756 / RHM5) TaxID=642492 RepID=F2JKM8_CELLD|nr:helix-turn-helix transcriptional regulator [Cellulosilyticum lentocellum]ADZ82188.1 DNA binding domain protein, excisionase family [Cellulosilyticum lentocellum DSM 5427]
MEKLYKPQEIADQLKIKKHTVYDLIKRGELQSTKIGKQLRISEVQLNTYLQLSPSTVATSSLVNHTSTPSSHYPENALLKTEFLKHSSGLIICGQDPVLDMLCSYIEAHPLGLPTLRSYMGSYNSLYALYFDKVHLATTHLWNGTDHSYNLSYIHHLLPGVETVVIHLFKRMQGFYVQKGNPKLITGFQDLVKPGITFVNREKGSGTRVLLDEHLRLKNISPLSIVGYEKEVLSHTTCAGQVAMGMADVAIGHANVLEQFPTLDFIPIQQENYDIVFKKSALKEQVYEVITQIIQSKTFKNQLSCLSGYDLSKTGTIIH